MVPSGRDRILPALVNKAPLTGLFIAAANGRQALAKAFGVVKLWINDKFAGLVDIAPLSVFLFPDLHRCQSF